MKWGTPTDKLVWFICWSLYMFKQWIRYHKYCSKDRFQTNPRRFLSETKLVCPNGNVNTVSQIMNSTNVVCSSNWHFSETKTIIVQIIDHRHYVTVLTQYHRHLLHFSRLMGDQIILNESLLSVKYTKCE